MKNTRCKLLMVFIVTFILSLKTWASEFDIRIKNTGTIPIYVAIAKVGGWLDDTRIEGWHEVKPSSWNEPIIYSGDASWDYYVTFAILNSDGDFGVVNYQLGGSNLIESSNRHYRVAYDGFSLKGSDKSMRTSSGKYVSVPFNHKISGSYYSDSYDIKLTVSPQKNSRLQTVIKYSERSIARKQAEQRAALKKQRAEKARKAAEALKEREKREIAFISKYDKDFCDMYTVLVEEGVKVRNSKSKKEMKNKLFNDYTGELTKKGLTQATENYFLQIISQLIDTIYSKPFLGSEFEGKLFAEQCLNNYSEKTNYKKDVSIIDHFLFWWNKRN